MDFLHSFKLVDALVLILFLKALYTAVKYGMLVEGIKWCAIFIAAFFSFQYYPVLLNNLESDFFKPSLLHSISFWLLLSTVLGIFFLVRKIVQLLIRREELTPAERWIAIPFALLRSVFLASVLVYGANLLPVTAGIVDGSASQRYFRNIAPVVYGFSFGLYEKIRPEAEKNKEVAAYYETKDTLRRSGQKGDRVRSAQ